MQVTACALDVRLLLLSLQQTESGISPGGKRMWQPDFKSTIKHAAELQPTGKFLRTACVVLLQQERDRLLACDATPSSPLSSTTPNNRDAVVTHQKDASKEQGGEALASFASSGESQLHLCQDRSARGSK